MKINKLLWVCLSLLLACGNKSGEEALNNYIIESGQVGPYKIGDPIPSTGQFDNFEIEASTETVAEEGETYEKPFNILSVENQEKIRFDFKYDSYTSAFVPLIREIIVTAPECKTAKGIGAGSTIEEFIKAYPDYTLWFTPLSDMFILETSELTVQFILKGEDFIGDNQNFDSDYNPLQITDFKTDAKIESVRIFQSSMVHVSEAAPFDKSMIHDLEKSLVDSVEFMDQDVAYTTRTILLFYDAQKTLKKASANTESVSGDAVSAANFYFDENGNTFFATYVIDVIPTNFWAEIEVGVSVDNGAKSILKAMKLKDGAKVEAQPSEVSDQLEDEFFVDESKQLIERKGISLLRKEDFIGDKADVFEVEGGMISGSDRFTDFKLSTTINKYTYKKYVVSEIPNGEDNGNNIYYRTINQKDSIKVPFKESAFFIGMWKDCIIQDFGTGVLRELSVFDIVQNKIVYSTPYILINIINDQLLITRRIDNPKARKWLPACEEEKAAGQGVDYMEVVKIDLKTLEENITGQIFCSVAQ